MQVRSSERRHGLCSSRKLPSPRNMALDLPKELRLAPWRQGHGHSEEVTFERRVVHEEVTFERRVRVVSRIAPTIQPSAVPRKKPPPPPPPTSSRVPPPPPPPRRLFAEIGSTETSGVKTGGTEAGCNVAMAMASPAKPKLMPKTARAKLGLASPLPKPKSPQAHT